MPKEMGPIKKGKWEREDPPRLLITKGRVWATLEPVAIWAGLWKAALN